MSFSNPPLIEQVHDGNVDVNYLIYHYAHAYGVPTWVDIDSIKNCNHCDAVLKSNKKHICRLDGLAYCSQCTTKLNLPQHYDLKGKLGPTRVCYGCRMNCLRLRQSHEGLEVDNITRTIYSPVWQDKSTFRGCLKCAKKPRSPHNCRCCGMLYCDECSSKLDLNFPPSFNKKNKTGPQRVCDGCRYKVIAGAVLSDGIPPPVYTRPSSTSYLHSGTSSHNASMHQEDSIIVSTLETTSSANTSTSSSTRHSTCSSTDSLSLTMSKLSLQNTTDVQNTNIDTSLHAQLFADKAEQQKKHLLGPKVMLDARGVKLRKVELDTEPITTNTTNTTNAIANTGSTSTSTTINDMDIIDELCAMNANLNMTGIPSPSHATTTNTTTSSLVNTLHVTDITENASVHHESTVLPSRLRKTVVDGIVPVPGLATGIRVNPATTTTSTVGGTSHTHTNRSLSSTSMDAMTNNGAGTGNNNTSVTPTILPIKGNIGIVAKYPDEHRYVATQHTVGQTTTGDDENCDDENTVAYNTAYAISTHHTATVTKPGQIMGASAMNKHVTATATTTNKNNTDTTSETVVSTNTNIPTTVHSRP